MRVSLIIPIFNGLEYTRKCLHSLYQQIDEINETDVEFKVVVVDDGSTDGSNEWIKKNFPQVHLIIGTGDLWWSGGINLGVKYAIIELQTDFIVWWNNDIIADEQYFRNLTQVLRQVNQTDVVGSKVYLALEEEVVWSMGGSFNPYNGLKDMIGRGVVDNESFKVIRECDWLPGMGTVMHKNVFDKIGWVDDENFPQYHGDSDFTYRAKVAGFRVYVDPRLILYNDTSNSGIVHKRSFRKLWTSLFSIRSNYNIRKNFIFYRKHAKSIWAYQELVAHYTKYIGGFIKWRTLELLGLKKKNEHNHVTVSRL